MIPFSREKTQILKGIGLLLMLVHHTSNPAYWAEEGSKLFSYFGHQVTATKMCVYIFAFLVGYGFFCSSNKTFRYSFKRILSLVVPFWAMLFILFIPVAYASGELGNALNNNQLMGGGNSWPINLIYNLFGISESLNWYSWFVCFYILTILSLPCLHKFYERFPQWGWLISIFAYYAMEVAIHCVPNWNASPLLNNVFILASNIPLVIVGYQCGYWNSKGQLPKWFEGRRRLSIALIAIGAVMLLNAFRFPVAGFCIQAFYTPILIFAVVGIFNSFEPSWLSKGLQKVGDLSMYMWFFHAIFFTTTVNLYTKALVFEPFHNYCYTLAMTFILTYAGSWAIKKLLSPVMQAIKRV
jgi:hypothetical protein